MARLLSMERKFIQNPSLKEEYSKFMKEYLNLGHMKPANSFNNTTKLRVVFDASAKTSNGKSLNDIMMVGPRLQRDIFEIIAKWRKWQFVLAADVEKMYRQIKISKKVQEYQHVLWMEEPSHPIKEYKLTTVTYGTASAPFLAVRALQKMALDSKLNYRIQEIIENDFYMTIY
ncbi:uncharacterized protein LOC119688548 [Teleopsis dalmanni]|uniref:uncharacterized protein LOC119688548 n=1 Tax=Teleopsis dalmanni TaxID=139649 RepID=UPI0018CCCC34|nr:uncharacterized protein LOC119688548 [Teleopsis dalmanni]